MVSPIKPLAPPPAESPFMDSGGISTTWVSWFNQLWLYARGPFLSSATGAVQMVPNTTFFADSASLTTLTLPVTFNVGDTIQVVGQGAGGWQIAQNTGQTIHGTSDTTTGVTGSLSSATQYDNVTLMGIVKNSDLAVVANNGTLTYV